MQTQQQALVAIAPVYMKWLDECEKAIVMEQRDYVIALPCKTCPECHESKASECGSFFRTGNMSTPTRDPNSENTLKCG